jgi:enoyl-CoA hydratase/carnithine racemase
LPGEVNVRTESSVAEVTLDNPDQRNAVTPGMLVSLGELIDKLEQDPVVRCLIVRGAGDWFSSGYALDHSPGLGESNYGRDVAEIAGKLERSSLISIAMVRGFAVGAGFDLSCACDFRFAERSSWFGLPAVKLGLVYPWRGIQRVRRTVGPAMAKRILLAAERIPCEEAHQSGLVARVFDNEESLVAGTWEFAEELARRSEVALSGMKRALLELPDYGEPSEPLLSELEAVTHSTMDGAELRQAAERAAKNEPTRTAGSER